MNRRRSISIVVDRKAALAVLAVALLGALAATVASQQLTMTATYPIPAGVYNQLVTTGNAGTAPADTTLNRNAGNTILVPPTNAPGLVGIGTAAPLSSANGRPAILTVNGNAVSNDVYLAAPVYGSPRWASLPMALTSANFYTKTAQITNDGYGTAALCNSGDIVISGGCSYTSNSGNCSFWTTGSGPAVYSASSSGWSCSYNPQPGTCASFITYVTAYCYTSNPQTSGPVRAVNR